CGAVVVDVPVYRYERPLDDARALALIDAVCVGRIDAVTFTAPRRSRTFSRPPASTDGRPSSWPPSTKVTRQLRASVPSAPRRRAQAGSTRLLRPAEVGWGCS